MTPPTRKKKGTFEIGVNLRVTQCFDKGGRNYMEDFSRYYFEKDQSNNQSVVFAFFGVFDGHGGTEAADLANQCLLDQIKSQEEFWSHDDNDVLQAIRKGFLKTHEKMVDEREKWPLTPSGFQSTAGTTASIAIIRNRKLYVGHVGDSAVVIGCCSSDSKDAATDNWGGTALTVEHKPDHPEERRRIEAHGGSVRRKAGIHRVVWNRPKTKGVTATASSTPVQMAAEYEEIPFLAVARSLGDLWSFDPETGEFHVSPEPDISVYELRPSEHRCLIIGSDGLWNVIKPETAVELVRLCERETESRVFADQAVPATFFYHPAGTLVQFALERCHHRCVRADNVTALVVMIDPPGKPMTQLRSERRRLLLARLGLDDRSAVGSGPISKQLESEGDSENDKDKPMTPSHVRRILVESQSAFGRDSNSSPTVGSGAETTQRSSDDSANVSLPTDQARINADNGPTSLRSGAQQGTRTRALPPLCVLRNTLQGPSGFPSLVEAWSEPCWRDMLAYCKQTGLANATSGDIDPQRLLEHLMDMDAKYRKEALQAVPTVLSMKRAFMRDSEMTLCLSQIPLLSREWTQLLVMSSSNPSSPTSPSSGHLPSSPSLSSPLGPPSPPACRRWLERRDKILNHLYQMLGRKLPSELSKDAQECMQAHVSREINQRMRISHPCDIDGGGAAAAEDQSARASRKSVTRSATDSGGQEADIDSEVGGGNAASPVAVKKEPSYSAVVSRTRRQRRLTSNGPEAEQQQRSPSPPPPQPPALSSSPLGRKPALRRAVRGGGQNAAPVEHLVLPTVGSPYKSPTSKAAVESPPPAPAPPQPKQSPLTKHPEINHVASVVNATTVVPPPPATPCVDHSPPAAADADADVGKLTPTPTSTPEFPVVVPWRSSSDGRRRSASALYPEEKARVDHLMEKLVVVVTPGPDQLLRSAQAGRNQKTHLDSAPPKPRPVLLPRSRAASVKRPRKSESDAPKATTPKAAVVLPQDYNKSYKAFFKKVVVDATAEARLEEVMRSVTYRTAEPARVGPQSPHTPGRTATPNLRRPSTPTVGSAVSKSAKPDDCQKEGAEDQPPRPMGKDATKRRRSTLEKTESERSPKIARRSLRLRNSKTEDI